MALFGKNPNESAYSSGKKHWADVVKNSGSGELLIWRQPEEDFNTNSTLVVMPGEEAIFIKGGVVEQVFDNGTYKFKTENYPFISRLRNAFTGGISTFNCVVYFVRKASSMEILWGTSSPIQVRDPVLHLMTSVRARGAFKIQIDNGTKFLTKLLGNNTPFSTQNELTNYFSNEFQQHIKSSITNAIMGSNREILGICAEQTQLARSIEPILQEILNDYGVRLLVFSVAGIDIPENDPNRQKLEDAFANKGALNVLGADWGRVQATEILHDLANNPGAGGVAAVGAGLGMGMAAGGVFGGLAQQMFAPMQAQQSQQPAPPQQPSGRFSQKSAHPDGSKSAVSVADEITKLKGLLDSGALTQEEFDAMKMRLLGL